MGDISAEDWNELFGLNNSPEVVGWIKRVYGGRDLTREYNEVREEITKGGRSIERIDQYAFLHEILRMRRRNDAGPKGSGTGIFSPDYLGALS
ncbi:MAG: hypothetical protein WCK90_03940 [archaeon]